MRAPEVEAAVGDILYKTVVVTRRLAELAADVQFVRAGAGVDDQGSFRAAESEVVRVQGVGHFPPLVPRAGEGSALGLFVARLPRRVVVGGASGALECGRDGVFAHVVRIAVRIREVAVVDADEVSVRPAYDRFCGHAGSRYGIAIRPVCCTGRTVDELQATVIRRSADGSVVAVFASVESGTNIV